MGLLLACMISRADLLGEALLEEREALDASLPKAADGWGAGFYQAGEALHRKLPQPIDGPDRVGRRARRRASARGDRARARGDRR